MAQQFTFPSETFPGYPHIALDAPDDWEPLHIAGMQLALAAPLEPGTFRPNVVAVVTRFGADYEMQTAIDAVREKFAGLEQSHEIGSDVREINGREWSHTESTFIDPRAGTLVQAVHLTVVKQGPVTDLVQLTASVTGTQAKNGMLDVIRDIQRSVVVTTD